jgi:hypothetical protein
VIIDQLPDGGYRLIVDKHEYAVLGTAMEGAREVVDGAPDRDAGERFVSQLVRIMCKQLEDNLR